MSIKPCRRSARDTIRILAQKSQLQQEGLQTPHRPTEEAPTPPSSANEMEGRWMPQEEERSVKKSTPRATRSKSHRRSRRLARQRKQQQVREARPYSDRWMTELAAANMFQAAWTADILDTHGARARMICGDLEGVRDYCTARAPTPHTMSRLVRLCPDCRVIQQHMSGLQLMPVGV